MLGLKLIHVSDRGPWWGVCVLKVHKVQANGVPKMWPDNRNLKFSKRFYTSQTMNFSWYRHSSLTIGDKICLYVSSINSLWPGDAIWRHGTRSTLAQVMACCLTAPSHYLSQCWLIIREVYSIHLGRLSSSEDLKKAINEKRLKMVALKWHPGFPGATELKLHR